MKTILAPSSSKLPMPNVNSVITNLKHVRLIDDQKDPSYFKCKISAIVKENYILIAEKCMSRIFEDQKKVCASTFLNNAFISIENYNLIYVYR